MIARSMYNALRFPRLVLLIGLILLCLMPLPSLWYIYPHDRSFYFAATLWQKQHRNSALGYNVDPQTLKDVRNSTLGFEKVFVINLPERTDKLDNFAVASSVTGFTAEVVEGVKGAEVQNKALPALLGLPTDHGQRDNIVGCWRAHLDFAQTIVKNKLTSALVIEDDADWDIALKNQLQLFAQGSQFVTGTEAGSKPHSPYGDDWDLIWLGHCGTDIMPEDQRRFVIENDATVAPLFRRFNIATFPDMAAEGYDNNTRIIFRAQRALCLYAYALSYRGARKLLRDQSIMTEFKPIDIGIGDWCQDNLDVRCIAVFPQIIDTHKAAGRLSRDSDIGDYSSQETRQKGFTFNIVHSARLNVDHLLAGEMDMIERQWPDDPVIEGPVRAKPMGRMAD